MAQPVKCKICGSAARFLCSTPNEHSSTEQLDHYRCAGCGLVFVGNPISEDELAEAYGSQDTARYYDETVDEAESKFRSAITRLDRLLDGDRSIRVIDIGSGNGRFPRLLHDAGYTDVSVHDLPGNEFRELEGLAVTIYRDFDFGSVPAESFDVVTLMDVAEHVVDPLHTFRQCHRMLRPGGIVYFHTPVVTRTDRAMHALLRLPVLSKVGRIWQRGRTSIFHLQNYTPAAFRRVLEDAGFEGVAIDCHNELSWPVRRFVRVYLCEKQNLPGFLAPVLAPLAWPFLATDFFNPNKGVVSARRRGGG